MHEVAQMQNEIITSSAPVAITGRSVDEITADIRVNYRNAKSSIIAIGRDLAEVKQLLRHGEWLPYLEGLNISVSSAENYMRYAAEVPGDDQLAALPYSAAMALIALPEPERQKVQEQGLEGKSAAEIKRLIAEVKKEKERANQAEEAAAAAQKEVKAIESTLSGANTSNFHLRKQVEQLQTQLSEERSRPRETVTVEVEKEVAPAGYDQMRREFDALRRRCEEAEDAAADAEERANAAVAQAQRAAMQQLDADQGDSQGDGRPGLTDFISICNDFQSKVWAVPFMQEEFRNLPDRDLNSYRLFVNGVKSWAERVLSAMDEATAPIPAEGVIIVDAE